MPLAKDFEDAIKQAASVFSDDNKPLEGILTQVIDKTGPSYRITGKTTNRHSFFCIWDEFTTEERLAGLVEDNINALLIGAYTLKTAPKSGDQVTVQDVTYDVKSAKTERAGGSPLVYRVMAKT